MAISPAIALRKSILLRLSSDAAVLSALSGAKIFDEAPRAVEAPYVLLGDVHVRDWSTADSRGAEHFVTLSVITTCAGISAALDVANRIIGSLDEAQMPLEGHRLIDFRFLTLETKRAQDGRFARAGMRFRGTTEYL